MHFFIPSLWVSLNFYPIFDRLRWYNFDSTYLRLTPVQFDARQFFKIKNTIKTKNCTSYEYNDTSHYRHTSLILYKHMLELGVRVWYRDSLRGCFWFFNISLYPEHCFLNFQYTSETVFCCIPNLKLFSSFIGIFPEFIMLVSPYFLRRYIFKDDNWLLL